MNSERSSVGPRLWNGGSNPSPILPNYSPYASVVKENRGPASWEVQFKRFFLRRRAGIISLLLVFGLFMLISGFSGFRATPTRPIPINRETPSLREKSPVNNDPDAQTPDQVEVVRPPVGEIESPKSIEPPKKTPTPPPEEDVIPDDPSIKWKMVNGRNPSKRRNDIDKPKREAVKAAMVLSWDNYVRYAWGYDELHPIRKSGFNWLGEDGLATTIVDSLDTLLIMGMYKEYNHARDWLVQHLKYNGRGMTSLFESTIRVLGGFVSAYELTGEKDRELLDKAEELGKIMSACFDTPSGIPYTTMVLSDKRAQNPWGAPESALSEVASIQLEWWTLSYHTKNQDYGKKAMRVFEILRDKNPNRGLFSVYVNIHDGSISRDHITMGALGDSFYEYLLKVHLLTGDEKWREMYDRTAVAITDKLVKRSKSGLLYIAELINGNILDKMDHLVCFAAGMFGLGAEGERRSADMEVAAGLTETCYQMYRRQKTGISPEIVRFSEQNDMYVPDSTHYILRPETVESLFIMWRLTHDQKYRDQGWEIFQAIEKYCRTDNGYSGIRNVNQIPVSHDDEQRSFFMAETLKYLYLLFSDDDLIPLDEYVFNTEAHPLKRRDREKK
ncbi:mannosyl-oligosaccharide 1,2-alpha-mannosidase IA-like isoform 2 [Planoprotostelium fungivorum]|uniref:alpha-1,2-Mannosidase n=1 Tax=Planoprotostelium fungivorum TaxID=1890364 RepID=A0A2P6NCJ4_9EUKA|nr:mannosyl-oligosaccharide 1,2-alpha-mannosidase IA-like isoform 2 [Planoprotostelium fungivorum]